MRQRKPLHFGDAATPKGAILDLDGTLIRDGYTMPGAMELLEHFAGRFVIASNNSTETGDSLSMRLARLDLHVPQDRFILAGQETLRLISEQYPGAPITLLASAALTDHASMLGLHPTADSGEIVVLCRDTTFDYTKLRRVSDLLRRGAAFFVANPDLTHPGTNGTQIPETGALLAAITASAGPVRTVIVGKPEPHLYNEALARLGLAPQETVMIGDNPETDVAGADALGIRALLIGPHSRAEASDLVTLLDRLKD